MNLIMLSGNSLRNREWIEQARSELANGFEDIYVQDYEHWHGGNEWIDLEHEIDVLKESVADIPQPYGIFAKSIGCVLAMQAFDQGVVQPSFVLLLGIPLDYVSNEYPQFKNVLEKLSCPIGIIHNTDDKVGSAQAVRKFLGEELIDSVRWHTPVGDTHDYEDYNLLRQELDELSETDQDY